MFRYIIGVGVLLATISLTTESYAAEEQFESSRVCMKCHKDIYRNWKKSLHALSYNNPIFLTAYRKAYTETKGEAKKYCLNCHAPTVRITGDYDMELSITQEGVTCDFCHTVAGIELKEKGNHFVLKPGNIKRSTLSGAKSDAHETLKSDDFASSRLCAGCHDFTNRNGVHVGRTYSEWKKSSYAKEGKQCQHCHMPEIEGKTAVIGGRDKIHDHSLSHNIFTMGKSVVLKEAGIKRKAKSLEVSVKITNLNVGHAIPTGTPARYLILEISSLDAFGRVIETKKKVYRKLIVDATGSELFEDGDVFLYGQEIVADNRIKPGETRRETFHFGKRFKEISSFEAETYFLYQPTVSQTVDMKISLFSEEWEVAK